MASTAATSMATAAAATTTTGCASVQELPASTALAKIIITRPLMTFSFGMGGTFRHRALSDAGVSEEDKCRRRDVLKMRMLICRCH